MPPSHYRTTCHVTDGLLHDSCKGIKGIVDFLHKIVRHDEQIDSDQDEAAVHELAEKSIAPVALV